MDAQHPRDILANLTPEELHMTYDYLSGVLDRLSNETSDIECDLIESAAVEAEQKSTADTLLSEIDLEALQRYGEARDNEHLYTIIGKHATRTYCRKIQPEPSLSIFPAAGSSGADHSSV